ncbi:MAG: 54S ribosomal protein L22, mitochondrial [Icmadophila ericetorum]|nr:54S ribosomal protein L22, mitochondrial [Icmadophila ericetorum]
MSLHLPKARLLQSATHFQRLSTLHPLTSQCLLAHLQTRSIFGWGSRAPPLNPLDEDFLKKKPAPAPPPPQKGGLASSSIFAEQDTSTPSLGTEPDPTVPQLAYTPPSLRNPETMAAVLDPQPTVRKRWQRKQVIKQIRQRGRLNKTTLIARTERQSLTKSQLIKTSVKKLGPLARQIAGKSVEDAIVQMRFSKKLVAREVLRQLEYARDNAIVTRGMGLGATTTTVSSAAYESGLAKSTATAEGSTASNLSASVSKPSLSPSPSPSPPPSQSPKPKITYMDKGGHKRTIHSPTEIYIDQAWVGRGRYERELSCRARGQTNVLWKPYTSISILLKEQATQIRLAKEREEKRARKKVWVNLPDRPISGQRQYYLW